MEKRKVEAESNGTFRGKGGEMQREVKRERRMRRGE